MKNRIRLKTQPGNHLHLLKREIHELVCDGVVGFSLKEKVILEKSKVTDELISY